MSEFETTSRTIELPDEQLRHEKIKREINLFSSIPFKFINDHMGLKPGKVHVLLGETGKGKSSITRAILMGLAKDCKVFLYATEEDQIDWNMEIEAGGYDKKLLSNIVFRHESELMTLGVTHETFPEYLAKEFVESKCHVLLFDNITTSNFYDGLTPSKQALIFRKFADIFLKLQKPLFLIAHTSSGFSPGEKRLIEPTDIAGSKAPARGAQFLYIVTRVDFHDPIEKKDAVSSFIRVAKARGYKNQGKFYQLHFSASQKKFTGDSLTDFDQFKACYDMRHKLSGK